MPQNFLKQIRESKKIGQSQLAKMTGVSKQLLSGFEKGRNGVSNEVLQRIGGALKVNPDHIMSGKTPDPFDEKGRKKLTEAMTMAFDFYGDEFDKETLVRVATDIYGLMLDFDLLKKDAEKREFREELESKIALGLAAKCLLKSKKIK